MNSDDITSQSSLTSPISPSSPSAPNSAGRRIRIRSLKRSLTGQEAATIPSFPSDDNDWVSPFTLPPLPALRKNRTQLNRSPEDRNHDRSGSSAYYAAAWGSPYATPSPNHNSRNKSFDLASSPLVSREPPKHRSTSNHLTRTSASAEDNTASTTDRSTSPSPIDKKKKSQRRNWLSESEDSGSDNNQYLRKTPKQRKNIESGSTLPGGRSHNVKASVDTITPETFNGASGIIDPLESPVTNNNMAEPQNIPLPAADDTALREKPLPNLPAEYPSIQQFSPAISKPQFALPAQSFQRPKKKVPWKGKSCIIAMPLTDREQAGLPPVMSLKDKRDRLQMWIDLGYPVHGFNVGDWYSSLLGAGGASRPTYPDFADMDMERKSTGPSVRIPNQGEWEAWVEYLKEEKLRALGVTPSTSEAPPSTHSPFSSTISRVSSTYPSVTASPPIPSMSVASNRQRMAHSPFSPSLSIPGHSNYFGPSQRGTPGLPNGSRPIHGYTQSIAIPGMGQRINSPFDYPISQPYGNGMRSPAEQISGRRPFTPGHVQNLQSMGHMLSPVNLPQQEFARSFSPNPQIEQIRRQQEALARHQQHVQTQIVKAQHQRQMSMFPVRTMSTEQMPVTPKIASPEREPPEIMHPTPRSHRHNLSAALEKGVTDSVAASSKGLNQALGSGKADQDTTKDAKEDIEEGEIIEEEDEAEAQEDLPILHRPETIKDADEQAEVETNPSIAGTPLLLDDKNPFSSFKPLPPPETSTKRPGFAHTAQPSLSMLNVQAKEFSPSKPTTAPNPFNFDGNAFADRANGSEKKVSHTNNMSHKHNPSSFGLNVAAPVFMPVFAPKPAPNEQPKDNESIEPFLPKSSQAVPPTTSRISADFKPSVLESPIAEASEFFTPTKPTFNPASSTFSFTGGQQQDVTPLKYFESEPQSSAFSFRSANFNVEAAEFKPLGLSVSSIDFTPEKPKDFTNGTIFGDVVLDPLSKPMRRTKALPIVKPQSREGSPVVVETETFDAEGRVQAPADRNKRARHVGGGDEEVLFADSAPFKSFGKDLEEPVDTEDLVVEEEVEEQPEIKKSEEKLPESVPATTALGDVKEEPAVVSSVPDTPQEDQKVQSTEIDAEPVANVLASTAIEATSQASGKEDLVEPEITEQLVDEAKVSTLAPVMEDEVASEGLKEVDLEITPEEKTSEEAVEEKSETVEPVMETQPTKSMEDSLNSEPAPIPVPTLSAEAPAFNPVQPAVIDSKPGLSPFAQPFDFRPAVKEFLPVSKPQTPEASSHYETENEVKPKATGLLASKFASSPPPVPNSPVVLKRESSPPKAAQETPLNNVETQPEIISDAGQMPLTKEQDVVEAESEPAMSQVDPASILARYREDDSRTGSILSRPGDLSYEEINAVMKQFEDDPDLGVIRDDTPVKETPLIDMRFPQNFRSDAPSPSPQRLDRPFNRGQGKPFSGLGFDISGVHQLNYGSPEIVDWNAELSPGQQDKLEARAHFFDDHVNDLVDNVLESRLAPLERALQNIQESVQQAAVKPRMSRRSMSTENKDSDADDEDDYDAYEGYSHYRSRSPHKRDRRSDKLKSVVIEAVTLAQTNAQPAKVDTTLIETALRELRDLTQNSMKQTPQPQIDLSGIQQALSELKVISQREVQAPVLDTSALSKHVEEMKVLDQQRGSERQANFLAMQTTLNELRNLASEKPAPPVLDLSSIHSILAELKQQAKKETVVPEIDLSTVHQALAELRQQASEKPAPPVIDLSSIQSALAELKQQAEKAPVLPEIDLSAIQQELAELRNQVSEKPAPPVVDLSAIQQELAELRKQAADRPAPKEVDLSTVHFALTELRELTEHKSNEQPDALKMLFENVISTHPRLASRDIDPNDEARKKMQSEIEELKVSLNNAEKRADGESSLRREAEEDQDALNRQLKDARDHATSHKLASEEAKKNLDVLRQEKVDSSILKTEVRDLGLKNEALERTLDEYRTYKEEMRDELEKERNRTDNLARALQDARHHHKDHAESRDSLREQLTQLQQRMSKVMQDVHHDEAEWRKREHDLTSKNQLLQAALDHETNRRARVELESERLNREHREGLQFKSKHELAQDEISRLGGIVADLQGENKTHQDTAFTAQRELSFLREKTEETIASKINRLQDDLDTSKSMHQILQSDSDARIARLQGQLDVATIELQEQKSKHEQNMQKMFENHNRAVGEVEQRQRADLERRLAFHEEKLIALKAQHSRDVKLATDEKRHIEQRYEDKLEMNNDKIRHLESKVNDLSESLAVTKSAARAAIEAATVKSANLPTPASSVMASPPHRGSLSGASMSIARGSDVPEKISPQALRETIMVLQDQLQNREQKIDRVDAQLAAIDKEAPAKVRERDTEIVMLRELLEVRVDDLQELINTLEKPGYDQTAVKDAAIRLKTQIKMEQQLKERKITGVGLANSLPSSITSGLANLTQSPRAMVAAAAWGNWQKVRDSGMGAVSDFANNLGAQTPSRVSSAPMTAMTGDLTSLSARAKLSSDKSQLPTARPLVGAAAVKKTGPVSPSSGARPLRAFNAQPRTLSGARPLARRGTNESRPGSSGSIIRTFKAEPPSTPIQLKAESDFGDDVDEDASPLDSKTPALDSDLEELVKSEKNAMKARSPRLSRSFADGTRKEVVQVIEES